jgi:Zn-finger nucleic acid-binding protein
MQHANTQNNFLFYFVLIVFVIVILFQELRLGRFLPRKSAPAATNFSAIIAFLTLNSTLELIAKKKLQDLSYFFYITNPLNELRDPTNTIACIYELELPYQTKTHLVGLSKKHGLDRVEFATYMQSNGMEQIKLEGDFPDHFDLYGPPGQQFNARVVLDPTAMETIIAFCDEHFWELNNDSFYIALTEGDHDNIDVVKESTHFAKLIAPVVLPSDPMANVAHHESSYGEYDGPALLCPICNTTMTLTDEYQQCPENHGILIQARSLVKMRQSPATFPNMTNNTVTHGELTCPNCKNRMTDVPYEGSNTAIISSCENCIFRWLDVNDIENIKKMAPLEETI